MTGASRGIGAAIATLAGRGGFAVAVNYLRNQAAANTVVQAIEAAGSRAISIQADVSDPAGITKLFRVTSDQLGVPTALVNNAAIAGGRSPIEALTSDNIGRILDVDLRGPILCISEAVRCMSTREGGRGGAIVNISSQAAHTGGHLLTPYVAAKAGLEAVTIGLARELGPHGIRVNAVSPGIIATEQQPLGDAAWMTRTTNSIPLGRLGRPDDVAQAVVWLLSPAAGYISGSVIAVTGGR